MSTLTVNGIEVKIADAPCGTFQLDINRTGNYIEYTWKIEDDTLVVWRADCATNAAVIASVLALLRSLPDIYERMLPNTFAELEAAAPISGIIGAKTKIRRGVATPFMGDMARWV